MNFKEMETAAKFHLLILSNIKVAADSSVEPVTFSSKTSIYEYIAKNQIAEQVKSKHMQIEMCTLNMNKFLAIDKLRFNLALNKKYKQFGDYVNRLQVDDNYFYSGLASSSSAGTSATRDDALRFYKDPTYLLCKLTNNPESVKNLITIGRLWNYALRWSNEENNVLDDINAICAEYTYINNVPLRVATFIKVWKKAFANAIIRRLPSQEKAKGMSSHSSEARQMLDKILELLTVFQKDIKKTKQIVKDCIKAGKIGISKDIKKIVKRILKDYYKISLKQLLVEAEAKVGEEYELEVKALPAPVEKVESSKSASKGLKFIRNMLYDTITFEAKNILTTETTKYYKHCTEQNIEKEYVITSPEGAEEIKEKAPSLSRVKSQESETTDIFYENASKIIELTVRVLQAELQLASIKTSKKSSVHGHSSSKKDSSSSKKLTVSEILNIKEKALLDSIWFYGNTSKQVIEATKTPKLALNSRVNFFATYMLVDLTKAYELAGMLGVDMDSAILHNVEESISEGNEKEIQKYYPEVLNSQ